MASISSPGVVGFSNQIATAVPNDIIPVSYFKALSAAANVDAAFAPKGTGAILGQIPDNAATGGNKRGGNAVDLQTIRGNATQVASGSQSTIGGGNGNTANGVQSVVSGGGGNSASGQTAAVVGGTNNLASGQESTVIGGSANTASGLNSIVGGTNARDRGIAGVFVLGTPASSGFTQGQFQAGRYLLGAQTINAVATRLCSNTLVAGVGNQVILPNNSVYKFRAEVHGFDLGNLDYRVSEFVGIITRGAGAGTAAVPVGTVETVIGSAGGGAAWVIALSADVANGGLAVTVTGAAGRNINWAANISTVELTS